MVDDVVNVVVVVVVAVVVRFINTCFASSYVPPHLLLSPRFILPRYQVFRILDAKDGKIDGVLSLAQSPPKPSPK